MDTSAPYARSLGIARIGAAATVLVGFLVLIGWVFDLRLLMQVSTAWTPMVPLTAATFCLAGASLGLLTRVMRPVVGAEAARERWRRAAMGLGVLVALIGASRLGCHLLGWASPVDLLGFVAPVGPGEMAVLTSVGFTLAGVALVLAALRRFLISSQWLAACVILIGWMSITRYLYGGEVRGVLFLVAVHTAVLFGVLGLGIFFARPDGGFMVLWNGQTAGSVLVRRLFPAALTMPVLIGFLRLLGERAGWYGLETGLAIFAMSNVVVFVALAWHTASHLHREGLARDSAERTLRIEKALSDALLDSLPGVFYLYDRSGRFLRWNREFESVSGVSGEQVARSHPRDFVDPADHALLLERVQEVFARGRSAMEGGFRHAGGGYTPYYFTGVTVEFGGEPCLAGVGIDISERRRAEDRIRELNADLELRVAARTAELEAKNRELETFTYSVSHDLKAPLRGIDGYSRILLEDKSAQLDDEAKRYLHTVRQATTQMGRLIDDLLAYAKLERREFELQAIALPALVAQVVEPVAQDLEARGVVLRLLVDDLRVRVDEAGLKQALRNLVDNAVKFSRSAARPEIEIGARAQHGRCLLWVRDNGVGFDMKFADRVFDIFQRLHRAEDYPGTGIGLALVRKAMERIGGRAFAESEPGHGATFFLDIPLQP